MKVLLVAHGYPPELVGGTEKSVEALARGLVAAGHEVVVVAGSMQFEDGFRVSRAEHEGVRVLRIHRADLYFDHWQKHHAHDVSAAFRELVREERPDLVHVHHWIRLSDDLVLGAAREGVPACVTLHDLWTSCLVTFRVRPDTQTFCDAPLGTDPCLGCAAQVPPRTPWLDRLQQATILHERKQALLGELRLARAVVAPTVAHARAVGRYLDVGEAEVTLRVVPHGRDLAPEDLGLADRGEAARSPLAPPTGDAPLVLGAWGHLHPLKGPDLLVEALRLARERGGSRRIELHLAGGEVLPAYAARLREAARDLPVTIHGAYRLDELGTLPVARVHAFVSGSRAHESWGLVLDEARALGLPMVLPASGAFPERLHEGAGATFYAPGDAASLADVLVRLGDDPAELGRLLAGAPSVGELVPSLARHVESLAAVYEEVAGAGAPDVPALEWFETELARRRRDAWDQSLSGRSGEDLGFV